jgi:hypothetical protein
MGHDDRSAGRRGQGRVYQTCRRQRPIDQRAIYFSLAGPPLRGAADDSMVAFVPCSDGVRLSADNSVQSLRLEASPEKRAIFNDTTVASLGRIELHGVTVNGCVQLLVRDAVRSGHVHVNGLDIIAADSRAQTERPHGYGVSVVPGAFTLWNLQPDNDAAISADLVGISAGRSGAPVRGSGVFVGGSGGTGGRLNLRRLETGAVYSDGGIEPGTRTVFPAASLSSTGRMPTSCAIVVR